MLLPYITIPLKHNTARAIQQNEDVGDRCVSEVIYANYHGSSGFAYCNITLTWNCYTCTMLNDGDRSRTLSPKK